MQDPAAEMPFEPSPLQRGGSLNPLAWTIFLLGGLAAAAVAAGLRFEWVVNGMPNIMGLSVAQSLIVGGALAILVKKLRIHDVKLAAMVALLSAASGATIYYSCFYVHQVYEFQSELRQRVEELGGAAESSKIRELLSEADADPYELFDKSVIHPKSGHHGFVGFMLMQDSDVWFGVGLQIMLVGWIALRMVGMASTRPFCEKCKTWFKSANALVLPVACADQLVRAFQTDNLEEIHAFAAMPEMPLGSGCVVAHLYTCPKCRRTCVNVVLQTPRVEREILRPLTNSTASRDILREALARLRER